MVGTPDSPHHLTPGGETTTLRLLFLSALWDLCAGWERCVDVSRVPMVMAMAQGVVWPVPQLSGVTPARRTPLHLGQAPVFNGCPGEACRGRRSGVLLVVVLSEGAASIASAGSFSAGSVSESGSLRQQCLAGRRAAGEHRGSGSMGTRGSGCTVPMAGAAPRHGVPSPSWSTRTWAGHPGSAGAGLLSPLTMETTCPGFEGAQR